MRLLFFILVTCLSLSAAWAVPQAYALQQEDSRVGFSWYLGPDEIFGQMPVARADIALDFDRLENSRVSVAVDVTRAEAGFPFASQGMKSQKVLWADKYPEIVFDSTGFRRDGDGAIVEGNLTVRGVTRPVAFDAQLFRQAGTEPGDRRRLSILLTGSLSRAAFGADGWSGLAGDTVNLAIRARMTLED